MGLTLCNGYRCWRWHIQSQRCESFQLTHPTMQTCVQVSKSDITTLTWEIVCVSERETYWNRDPTRKSSLRMTHASDPMAVFVTQRSVYKINRCLSDTANQLHLSLLPASSNQLSLALSLWQRYVWFCRCISGGGEASPNLRDVGLPWEIICTVWRQEPNVSHPAYHCRWRQQDCHSSGMQTHWNCHLDFWTFYRVIHANRLCCIYSAPEFAGKMVVRKRTEPTWSRVGRMALWR